MYESGKKPNKLWVDQESEFHNRLIKYGCKDNDIEIYLAHNGRKSVVAKRLNSTLNKKIYKPVTEVSKNKYTDMLDEKVDKYNSRYHRTIKIKPIDVLSQVHTLTLMLRLMTKILNSQLVIMWIDQNTKMTLLIRLHSELVWRSFCSQKGKEHCAVDVC